MRLFRRSSPYHQKPAASRPVEVQQNQRHGLSAPEAQRRLASDGPNEIKTSTKVHPVAIFLSQFSDIMIVILLICTLISMLMGEYFEAGAIALIVLMNGVMGFVQEYRTEKTLEALRNMASPTAKVYRDGQIVVIDAAEIVVGDVVVLESGNRIPADGRVLSAFGLEADEAMLTGESLPVSKQFLEENKDADERRRQVFMGCTITKGHGEFLVTATGMLTEMGRIASMLEDIEEDETPLQRRLAQLSKFIAAGCLLICATVSATGILRGEKVLDMLITGVSLAVAAVPEGLPAIVTISLALAVSRMIKRKALVRKLHAVETLGCATIICSDKTGTLTQNRMTVTEVFTASGSYAAEKLVKGDSVISLLLQSITACNNAILYERNKASFGEHTEICLLNLAKEHGLTREALEKEQRRIAELPFDSTRKRMSVVVESPNGQRTQFVKGAFDLLISRCVKFQTASGPVELTTADRQRFTQACDTMADQALRVIAVAYKPELARNTEIDEEELIFLGLIGMMDPPRKEVKAAVNRCRLAGIGTIMITGDHLKTAIAVARQIGIYHENDAALMGQDLDQMSDDDLDAILDRATVFARVNPGHKLRIVRALKRKGEIVAMTGDGVNDAPAVKEASIGVAMGTTGTDVTKEASDIILLDDNFATLVNAIEEGRSIYANIRKFIRYLLACNIGEVLTMFLGMLLGLPVILFPIQILFVNLVTDGLPAIALGLEPSDARTMFQPPRAPDEGVFSNGLAPKIFLRGVLIGLSTLASFLIVYRLEGLDVARTAALYTLVCAQLIHVFECKSEDLNLFRLSFFNNKKLILASLFSLLMLFAAIYWPPLQPLFSVVSLSDSALLTATLIALIAPLIGLIM